MYKKDTGGAAFPCNKPFPTSQGMSLRDWFAGMALQGMISNNMLDGFNDALGKSEGDSSTAAIEASISEAAYDIADAMIKDRDNVK